MLLHHLKIAIRSLLKQKGYTAINISGLTLGMICVMFILIYVKDELSYDRFHADAERIYRITGHGRLNGGEFDFATAGAPVAEALVRDFPEVEAAMRFRSQGSYIVSMGDQHFKEERVSFVDSSFFDFFSIPLVRGESGKVLHKPNSLAMSSTLAKKYFGEENPIGKTLRLDNRFDYKVTGVFEPIPGNSHFHYDILLSMSSLSDSYMDAWTNFNYITYLRLRPDADPQKLESKLPQLATKYIGPEIQQYLGISMEEFEQQGNHLGFKLQALVDIHLYSDLSDEHEGNGDINYVYLFAVIGLFILLIACINFMNLTTARSASRALEVGIKKVVGAQRAQLIAQFLTESVLLSLLSLILALAVIPLLLPYFNDLAGKTLEFSALREGFWLLVFVALTLGVGILAGSYPAFYLSAFTPMHVLKGSRSQGVKSGWLRSSLVVFQFTTTVFLIVGTIVVFSQMQYVQDNKLGFDKEQVLILHDAYVLGDQLPPFKTEVLRNPNISHATVSGFLPVPSERNNSSYYSGASPESGNTHIINNWRVDYDYVRTLGLDVVNGRDFSRDFPTDSNACLVNQALVQAYGWQDPIGQTLSNFGESAEDTDTYHVVGVLEDFHFASLRDRIEPLMMYVAPSRSYISLRLNTSEVSAVIEQVEGQWDELSGGQPFAYSFLNERFDRMHRTEQRFGTIFGVFAGLSILIACLGLLGLATYTAEQRTKEIGIRKILGASVWQIIGLLSREYAWLLGIAFVLGSALAFWAMHLWLAGFAYRTSLSTGIFGLAALLTFLIAAASVSYQSIKAAMADPANSLRYE